MGALQLLSKVRKGVKKAATTFYDILILGNVSDVCRRREGRAMAPSGHYLNPPVMLSNNKQEYQLSQRDCAAGCVIVLAKSGRLELGDNI